MFYSYTEGLALSNFINALLNEWAGYQKGDQAILIEGTKGTLILPLSHDSLVQRFSFHWPAKLRQEGQEQALSFADTVAFICALPCVVETSTDASIEAFKQQVFASQAHMSDVLLKRQAPINIDGFIAAEQSLVGGHNLHPASKTHQGWDQEQAQVYSPDYANEFALSWYFVESELIAGETAAVDNNQTISLSTLLLQSYQDAAVDVAIPDGFVPYPVHPHQAQVLERNQDIQDYIRAGSIIVLGEQGNPWRATSSTRALWQQGSRWMLKFSLAVKLTNSIRHLSTTELSRGVLFQQISQEIAGAEFKQRFKHFNVMQEPAWVGLKANDGNLLLDSLFCWRENLYPSGKEPTVALATMTQEDEKGSNAIANLVTKLAKSRDISIATASTIWFEYFLENVIKPVTVARSDYGIVMLAHQQNLLVTLEHNLPVGGAFRDCQGTGYTDTALARFPLLKNNKPALFLESEAVNPYFSYYLILNSLNSVIAALSSQLSDIDSERLIHISQNMWRQLAQHSFYDASFYEYLLTADTLKIKGNFFCFLSVKNETELKDVSQIYKTIKNPYQLIQPLPEQVTYKPIFFDSADVNEKATSLMLIFSQQEQGFSVESSRQQWHFHWQSENGKDYLLSKSTGLTSSACLVEGDKMSSRQWFNVIEHCFEGLAEENSNVAQSVAIKHSEWLSLTEAPVPDWAQLDAEKVTLTRAKFFQSANIWTLPKAVTPVLGRVTAKNGIEHPMRPKQPDGIFFQRYIYPLQRVISLRCADVEQDVAIFSYWHNKPNVARMWELAGDIDSHRDYLTKQTEDAHSMAVIGYFDGVPFGYFEMYWAAEDRLGPYYEPLDYDRGVHMLVGNQLFLGHKHFFNWSRAVMHAIFMDEKATLHVMGEPRADNVHVARITQNIGMRKLKEFDFPHKRSALMCCERASFFNSFI